MEADEDFTMTEGGTEEDDEQTLEEEEQMEQNNDHNDEIDNLQKEGMVLTALSSTKHTCISANYFGLGLFAYLIFFA